FQALLRTVPDQSAGILCNWGSALGELGMYPEAVRKFEEAERIQPDSRVLHKNWSSILVREAPEQAANHAERANAIEPGEGSYNLACIAAGNGDRPAIERWLTHSAEYGKIPSLSHILYDRNFEAVRSERWFGELLDRLFGAGQDAT